MSTVWLVLLFPHAGRALIIWTDLPLVGLPCPSRKICPCLYSRSMYVEKKERAIWEGYEGRTTKVLLGPKVRSPLRVVVLMLKRLKSRLS